MGNRKKLKAAIITVMKNVQLSVKLVVQDFHLATHFLQDLEYHQLVAVGKKGLAIGVVWTVKNVSILEKWAFS
ncbi:hypothetical protein [Flagellimonas aurea]|uniref:hypothetical protein n=1 Tax=Flagellimonas aurea TaxID=2915619 RepID=UPI0035CF821E